LFADEITSYVLDYLIKKNHSFISEKSCAELSNIKHLTLTKSEHCFPFHKSDIYINSYLPRDKINSATAEETHHRKIQEMRVRDGYKLFSISLKTLISQVLQLTT
jgi:hypothetical protein